MTQGKPQARGLARRQAMLDAATDLFLEKGFKETSLTDIVDRSKGSRSTLYEQFGNKEGLLRAMVEDITADIWMAVDAEEEECALTEEGLIDLARRFVGAALAPRAIAVFRILSTEGSRLTEIVELFFERGPGTAERLLANRFRAGLRLQKTSGLPEQLARVFLGAILGVYHPHRVLGLTPIPDDAGIDAHIRLAVRLLLDGIKRQFPGPR